MATPPVYNKGDEVYVFYRMGKRCSPQRKYLAVLDQRHGAYRPRIGMSDGWVPARVVAVEGEGVKVEYRWKYFFTQRGHMADPESGWTEWYPIRDVRKQAGTGLAPAGLEPQLTLITFRWGGINEVIAPGQWGETGSSVSDIFIDSFVDSAVVPRLGNNFEVWTVYVEDHSDMVKMASTAHLIFGPNHPARRAPHVGAMYHLYPTSFEENCIPSKETGQDGGAALVDQKSFFTMQKAMERAGIPTRFPHPSGLYELLASKRWTYMMSTTPHLRVPPTIAVPRMLVEQSCAEAAKMALASLNAVKQQQAKLRNEPAPKESITKGVAKLGFSWEALDVKFWENESGLDSALHNLTQTIEISDELTGQPHDLESIIVQEYCKHDLEVRLYYVEGKLEATIYTKFCKIKDNLEFGDFHEAFVQSEAAKNWMGGDYAALEHGEKQCREIAEHWLVWVQGLICEMPPAIRFDFFCGRSDKAGEATVWTLEICELGFSMLGEKELPYKVFAAMCRSCLREKPDGTSSSALQAAGAEKPAAKAAAGSEKKKKKQAAPDRQADEVDSVDTAASSARPNELTVKVAMGPGVTKDQEKCSGQYTLVPHADANGFPVWVNSRGDRFLYHGNDEHWYVGDEEEQDMNFDCDQGYIRHEGSGSLLPHQLTGAWERGEDWTPDSNIWISVDGTPPSIESRPPRKSSKGKGKGKNGTKGFGKGSP